MKEFNDSLATTTTTPSAMNNQLHLAITFDDTNRRNWCGGVGWDDVITHIAIRSPKTRIAAPAMEI